MFAKYVKAFRVTPDQATKIVIDHYNTLPDESRKAIGVLGGVINDEYHFALRDKKGFLLSGYRVDVETGRVRIVTRDDVYNQFGKQFPSLYVPNGEIRKFLPKSLVPKPKSRY